MKVQINGPAVQWRKLMEKRLMVYYWLHAPGSKVLPENLALLSDEELGVLSRQKSTTRRFEYVMGRCLVRGVLAGYLGMGPRDIVVKKNGAGKLYLDESLEKDGVDTLQFNLSHTRGITACVIGLGVEVGIDVERTDRNVLDVGLSFFSKPETDYIRSQPKERWNETACMIWTMKEAYVKAMGYGLGFGLENFNVLAGNGYFMETVKPTPDYYLSVAANGAHRDYDIEISEVREIPSF